MCDRDQGVAPERSSPKAALRVNDLGGDELGRLLAKSDESSLFRCNLLCPIDEEHIVDVSRVKTHLRDCHRRNAHLLVARCPFSEFHYCRASALAEHKERCPDRSESIYSGEATEEMRMLERQMAVVQMVELKVQCGLPVSDEERRTYDSRGVIEARMAQARRM